MRKVCKQHAQNLTKRLIVWYKLNHGYNHHSIIVMKDIVQPPAGEVLPPQSPVLLKLNGSLLPPGLHYAEAKNTFELKFSETANLSTAAYVLKTPLDEYVHAHDAIPQRDGENTDLGNISSIIHSGKNPIELSLDTRSLYDVFVVHNDQMTPTRISTGEKDEATGMTFDEMKLLLAIRVGLSPEELIGVFATVIADRWNMINRNELAHFGLRIDNLVATISQQQMFGMFFVDRNDFWRVPTSKEFREHLLQRRIPKQSPNDSTS